MQIVKVDITPVELRLRQTVRTACAPPLDSVHAIFVQLITQQGQSAWGCTVADPHLTGEELAALRRACQACADRVPDLHPTHLAYTMAELGPLANEAPSALVAFDLAFHDLLGLLTGLPLYRLLGGYRSQIPTSVTIPCLSVQETIEVARRRAQQGFRILKLKGGFDPEEDVAKVKAIHRALPQHTLRLDADGAYSIRTALEVASALEGRLEMLEQPTPPGDLAGLRQVSQQSRVPVLADQAVTTPESALAVAAGRCAEGFTIKVATAGGVRPATQFEAIARAAQMKTLVSCVIEPRLLIAAGLAIALSSPNVHYTDLDGHLDLVDDPSGGGFDLTDGCLTASEVPGLGCRVELG
jgi:L-alanine-DL-glutamate epimerase-like enolase superfamily enzyme